MNYLNKIGENSKKAFKKIKNLDHKIVKKVLNDFDQNIKKNKNLIINANQKDVKNVKRKHLIDRLILSVGQGTYT